MMSRHRWTSEWTRYQLSRVSKGLLSRLSWLRGSRRRLGTIVGSPKGLGCRIAIGSFRICRGEQEQ